MLEDGTGRRLLAHDIPVSALGFGCSSLWSKPSFPSSAARRILDVALGLGINHFDTGPSYAEGEARLGAFLADVDRARLVISTKVGTEHDMTRSFDPERMRRSLTGSLARLGVAKVDILYLHGPGVADLTDAVLGFLGEQKAAGRAALVGVNSFDPAVLERLIDLPIDVVMLQYSVADPSADAVIGRLHAAGKTVIAGTVLGRSIYAPKTFLPRGRRELWYLLRALRKDPLFPIRGARLARRLARVDSDPHAAAIRFVTSHPLIASCLFGSTSADHIAANIASASRSMSPDERRLLVAARAPADTVTGGARG